MEKGGKEKAFAGVLANPPHTTRQIMQPETYLSGEQIAPMPVSEFKRDFKDYVKFDIGAMGEFDVAVLVEQYAGKEIVRAAVSGVARRILLCGASEGRCRRAAGFDVRVALVERGEGRGVCRRFMRGRWPSDTRRRKR